MAKLVTGVLAAALLLGLTACRTTHQVRGTPEESGFLKDYSLLKPGTGDEAKLRYVAPDVNWAKFTKVYIEPIELWKSDETNTPMNKLDQEDQQLLVSYFYTAMSNALSKDYTIVNEAGPACWWCMPR